MKVVIVESPTKAKTINKYLGRDYTIVASYGHIRDLPSKDGSVKPSEGFTMEWDIDPKAEKNIQKIIQAVKNADELLLATDPDREGEAISWHVCEVLKERKALKGIPIHRVVFHEITKRAVTEALNKPRDLNHELVEAYLTRRALDYLVGFTLSPVLWRKVPGSRSAGRVQSVALRLISDRETEIERFIIEEYWTVLVALENQAKGLSAKLTHLDGTKLDKFSLPTQVAANRAVESVGKHSYTVITVEKRQAKRHPAPPFTTSTLQQEASRKLGFSASRTMRLAQQLYEGLEIGGESVGLITYMRTDSVQVSTEALTQARDFIAKNYGKPYLPSSPRAYKSKAKNAQEAHEAIRPTDIMRHPDTLTHALEKDHFRLYELIWKRMVASQMESALIDQVGADFANSDRSIILHATGSSIAFDGFLKLYVEGRDEDSEENDKRLPSLEVGEVFDVGNITPEQHFTQPPARYTEASLVKKLEELGIGRPSTYASIIQTLQDRQYVVLEKRQFHPTDRGRIVVAFLAGFFQKYIQYDFTAHLEEQLDEVSAGHIQWKRVLEDFWKEFIAAIEAAKGLTLTEVIDHLDQALASWIYPPATEDGLDPRQCSNCPEGKLHLKLGKFGAFLGCSNYPTCNYTRRLTSVAQEEGETAPPPSAGPLPLGTDPAINLPVTLRQGPYGFYFQWGEAEAKSKTKPKRISLPKQYKPEQATLEMALQLAALPRVLGTHPESGETIAAGLGRFGPYLQHGKAFTSLPPQDDVLTVELERAIEIIQQAGEKQKSTPGRRSFKRGAKKK